MILMLSGLLLAGEKSYSCGFTVGESERKGPLRRPRHTLEDNINIDVGRWDGRAWTGSV